MIGLSPLPTGHPSGFQPTPVRASTGCYPSFTLPMGRSPWLRVYPLVLDALLAGLAFAAAPRPNRLASHERSNSPDHNAKGTPSAEQPPKGLPASDRLSACGFRLSFTPRPGVLFTCPSRYSSTIGHTGVFSLGGWTPQLHARFHESDATQDPHHPGRTSPTGLSPSMVLRSRRLRLALPRRLCGSYNPASTKTRGLGSAHFARRYSGHLG